MSSRIVGALLILLAVCTGTARAGGQSAQTDGRFLSREEIRLHGLKLDVTPAEQVVPRDIATIVSALLVGPPQSDPQVSPFAPDAEVRATLRGPGLAAPIDLAVKPGNPFNIPALKLAGIYTLDNIRLVSGGEILLRGTPESARIEVIDKLLVSQVSARALTADEIRERGIVYDRTNFQAYNFSAAFAIQDTPITINFPVLLPRLSGADVPDPTNQSVPGVPTPSIPQLSTIIPDTLKLQTKLPNLQVVGFSLTMPDVKGQDFIVPPIPGIIAIPGDIGFLNQYFSVMLMVGNVAPSHSNLVVTNLRAEILLPLGRDRTANTGDEPLAMAMTTRGESPRIQIVAQPGPDGKLGTADDIASIGPGQSGNAEYLVEGRREGSHVVEMRMTGTLEGLPVGPVPVTGVAMGSVLVRNPTFALTFTHPEVVTAGEAYTLDVTVSNTSQSPANFVSLNLHPSDIGGATLVGPASQAIETIAPGDSATVSFQLVSKLTGKVFAATLDADDGVTGRFGLKTSVGELGVPLSPDSLVLPQEASTLPKALRDAAIGLLGKAWAVATAPPAAVPADLQRFSRKIVLDRAVEVAEAGLRVTLNEPLRDSASQLALDFLGSNFPRLPQRNADPESLEFERTNYKGFDLLRRRSVRGDVFADVIASMLRDDLVTLGAAAFHRDLAAKISYRPSVVSVLASSAGPLPVRIAIADAAGRRTAAGAPGAKVTKEIPFSDLLQFKDGANALTSELAIVGAPEAGLFTLRLARAAGAAENTPFTLSVVLPNADGSLRHVVFDSLVAGQRPTIVFAQNAPYRLAIEWVEIATTGDVTAGADSVVADPAPTIVSVVQRASADRIVCEAEDLGGPQVGRIVAVLFSEEVTPESAQDKLKPELITNYAIDGNAVVGVALQPGRRIAYLALRDPFGPLVPRSLSAKDVEDPRGNRIDPRTMPIVATVEGGAGVVSGQVLRADGTPAAHVNVRLFYRSPCGDEQVQWIGISSKITDADGRYSWDRVVNALQARVVAVDPETGDVRDARFQTRADGQRLNVNLVFLGRGTVTGRTFGPDGATPLKDTFVRVTSLTDQSQWAARTDATGRFTIARVPVGSVVIDAVNTTAVAKTTVSDLIPFAGATLQRDLILMDAASEPITIKRGNLSGFVLEGNGRTPAPNVPVIAYYRANSQPGIPCPGKYPPPECAVAVTTSAADGAYAFPNVVAGSLRLQTFNQSSFEQGQVGLNLAENQTLTANIVLGGGLGTVRGVVLDPSGRGVANASVGGGLSLVTTDTNGNFVLTDVPVGTREIVAASNELGSLAKATVELLYAGHEVNVTIVLDSMGSVSGLVTRTNGSPATGIKVYVFKRDGEGVNVLGEAVTNTEGGYRIDKVPAGSYDVSAFTSDFSDGNIVPVVVAFHKQVAKADIQFRGGGGRVTGRVFADDGATPLRARVSVSGEQVIVAGGMLGVEFRRIENFKIVDTNLTTGKYALGGLFVGPFTLRAAGPFSPDPIALQANMPGPNQEIEVNLVLQPTSRLAGTVYLPDGVTPVGANVHVTFKSSSFKTICREGGEGVTCENIPQGIQNADAVTDQSGAFLFPVLNAGPYTLTVEDGPGGRSAVAQGTLAAGQQGRMDLRLLARADLTVTVLAADASTPIPNARVEASQVGAPYKKLTFTANPQGIVTFSGADAFSEGEIVIIATDLRNGATGRGRAVIAADGQPQAVPVHLHTASGVVFGRVLRPDGGTPVPNAEVIITSGAHAVAFATTDSEGRYREIGIPLGAITVDIFEAATARRGSASGTIASNGTQLELNVVEEALGVVRGRVVAAVTLEPLKAWRVTLSGRTPSGLNMPALITTTSIDGSFSFPGTPLGQFTITAIKPGEPGTGTATATIVREGELVEVPVIATIPRTAVGTIRGTVVDHLGAPVANASITYWHDGVQQQATADQNGLFTLASLRLGRYGLYAFRQNSSEAGSTQVELTFDGQVIGASVVLNGLSTITGTVTQNGSPVGNARVKLSGQPNTGCAGDCTVFANGSGVFTFERVSARTFTLVASNPNQSMSGSMGDRLNPGETKQVTIALEPTRRVYGRVLNAAGTPVAGVVGEMTLGGRKFFAETDQAGLFDFAALPLGAYTLALRDATGPGMAGRVGTLVNDTNLGDVELDEAPPRVAAVTPLPSAVAVARTQAIVLQFSEAIDRATIGSTTIKLSSEAGPVLLDAPVFRTGDTEVVLQPSSQLQTETRYTISVTGVRDRAGRPMTAPFTSTFTTVDTTAPTLVDAAPASGANGISAHATIRLRYSEPIQPTAFEGPAIQLLRNGTPVAGRVDIILGNTTIVFTPNLPLAEDATYQVRAQAATDLSGNKQPAALDYTFTTTDRTPPTITALVAAGNGTVIENGLTQVTASTGAAHDVAFVDFYLNDQLTATTGTAPYVLALKAVPALGAPGASIKVVAVATDTSGNRGPASAALLVPITPDAPPAVALLAPATGGSIANGSPIAIRLRATDDLGAVQVGYRVTIGGVVKTGTRALDPARTDATEQFDFLVPASSAPNATVRIEPTALDTKGQAIVGSAVELRVLDAAPPAIKITGASSGATVKPGQSTTAVVEASDPGLVKTITFTASGAASFTQTRQLDPAQASVATAFTFTVPASASATETVTLTATATDLTGNLATAATVILPVADLVPPSITLRTQSGRNEMVPGAPLVLIAEADDALGVSHIQLTGSGALTVADGKTIDPPTASATATFTVLVPESVPLGASLTLQARAMDAAQNLSTPATLVVTAGEAVGVTLPASAIINAGATQTIDVGLQAPAGAAGVTVALSTLDPAIATVTSPVVFAQNEQQKSATVTAKTNGTTQLIATVAGVERARMTITVQGGIVTGIVRDPDLNPVDGASVTVISGGDTLTTTSGAGGRYTVHGVTGTQVSVRARQEATGLYGVSASAMPQGGFLELDVVLIDAGSVTGTVRTPQGVPTGAGVQVTITTQGGSQPQQTVFTNQSGVYEFPLVAVGAYTLDAEDQAGNRGRSTVTIAGADAIERHITFLGRGRVTGIVKTDGGQAVPGAALTFTSTSVFGVSSITRAAGGDGKFDFTGVFVGSFKVDAKRDATGENGTVNGTIDSHEQTVDVTVTLSPVGTLTGLVRRADDSTVPNATVSIDQKQATTDSTGRYRFEFLPAGPVKPTVYVTGTRERGIAQGTVVSGQTTELEIRLAPQGRLNVTVTNGVDPIANAAVDASSRQGDLNDSASVQTGTDGLGVIDRLMASNDVTVRATANGVTKTVNTTLSAGETKPIAITLDMPGEITGTVFEADNFTRVTSGSVIRLNQWGNTIDSAEIGANGVYRFPTVTSGTYGLAVRIGDLYRARVTGIVMPATGGVITQNVTVMAVGTVKGRVLNGSAGVPNVTVTVEAQAPSFSHTRYATTDGAGFYEATTMIVGPIFVSAGAPSLRGEASGTLTAATSPLTLDIALVNNSTTLPRVLYDANASAFDMQVHGGLSTGSNAFSDAFRLDIVSGGQAFRFNGAGVPTQENGNREIATRQSGIAGLNVTRKLFVPAAGYFGRWLEILSNPTGAPITVDVRVTSGINSGNNVTTSVLNTSSGDALLDVSSAATADRWVMVDDDQDLDPNVNFTGAPAVAVVFDGPEAATRVSTATHVTTPNATVSQKNVLQYTWTNVTIEPGQSVAFMHFGVKQVSRAGATASAERLVQLPPEALAGLNPEELPIIRNFAVPADGNSTLLPLAPMTGRVTGKLFASDGTTPIPFASVWFKSSSPYFGRRYSLNSSAADGSFALQGVVNDWSSIAVSTGDAFTVWARHPESQIEAPQTAGTFADGTTQTTRDIVFSNTGMIKGLLVRSSGPVTTGTSNTVQATYTGAAPSHAVGATASFVFTGVPAGTVTLKGTHYPVGTGTTGPLTGTVAATVTAGQTTTQDVLLDGANTVTGSVKNGTGSVAVNTLVELSRSGFSRQVRTDSGGRYTIVDVPAGAYTLRAQEPNTGIWTTTSLTTVVETPTEAPELQLIGIGTLNVAVTFGNGQPVGAGVTVRITEPSRVTQTRTATTNGSGTVTFTNVTMPTYMLRAWHPSSTDFYAELPGVIVPGQTTNVTLKLPSLGSVQVHVERPGTEGPAEDVLVGLMDLSRSNYTNAAGNVTFTSVPANKPFRVRALGLVNNYYTDSAEVQITADQETLPVTVKLPAIATLKVQVNRGDDPAVGVRVQLQNAFETQFGQSLPVDATGAASFEQVPQGLVKVRVTSETSTVIAESTATIAAADHGQTVTTVVDLGGTLPRTLLDANGFAFDIEPNGSTLRGSVSPHGYRAYSGGLLLNLWAGGVQQTFAGATTSTTEANGRELVITDPAAIGGLQVTRKVFVPRTGYFARYLELLHNPTGAPITVDVEVASQLASGIWTHVVDELDGRWIATDDTSDDSNQWPVTGQPLAHVFAGDGATLATPTVEKPASSNGKLGYRWNAVTVPAGQTVAVMHFAVQQPRQGAAQASAERLVQLPPEALADLSAAEIAAVGNFVVPPDGVGTVPPLNLAPSFTASGRILTYDGATPVSGQNQVTLRSSHPLYTGGKTVTSGSNYSVTGVVVDDYVIEVTTHPPAPFSGWTVPMQVTRPRAGQTSVTEDIAFTGTGSITGKIVYANGDAVTEGLLYPGWPGAETVEIAQLDNGTFTLPVVPAGPTMMSAGAAGRERQVEFTVAPNATTPVEIRLPAMAQVRIRVTNTDGSPVAYPEGRITKVNGTAYEYGDSSGTLTFWGVYEGPWSVRLTDRNYTKSAVVAGVVTAADENKTVEATARLRAVATLRAIVTRNGQPVEGLAVSASFGDEGSLEGTTDADGIALMPRAIEGPFTLYVKSPDGRVIVGQTTGTVPASADGQTVDVPVALTSTTTTVKGALYAADGQTPLRSYDVRVRLFDGTTLLADDSYQDSGAYELAGVPLPQSGSLTVRVNYNSSNDERFVEATVAVSEGQVTTRDFTLPLNGVVGTVTAWDGQPLHDGEVRLIFDDGSEGSTHWASLDEEGRYAAFEVPAQPFQARLQVWTPNVRAYASGEVTSSTAIVHQDFLVGRVRGTVRYADGTPVVNPMVIAEQEQGGQTQTYNRTTPTAGNYEIRGPQPGAVTTLTATHNLLEGQATVTITPGAADVMTDITLEADGTVTGVLRDANDGLVEGATVFLSIQGLERETTTDTNGRFTFTHVKLGGFLLQATVGDAPTAARVTLSSETTDQAPLKDVAMKLPATVTLTGRVIDAGGQAVDGAQVVVENRDHNGPTGHWTLTTTTDAAGAFTAPETPVGNVTVTAFKGAVGGTKAVTVSTTTTDPVEVTIGGLAKLDPPYVLNSDGFRYDIACNGAVRSGGLTSGDWLNTFQNAFALNLAGGSFPCRDWAAVEDGAARRQLRLDGGLVGDLLVSRKIYVPASGSFVRYLEVVTNPGTEPRTAYVNIDGMLGTWSMWRSLLVSPVSTNYTYAATWIQNMGTQAFVFGGPNAPTPLSYSYLTTGAYFSHSWTVTVPPGETRIVMHFASQFGANSPAIQALAQELVALTRAGALDGMTAEEKARVVNFRIP